MKLLLSMSLAGSIPLLVYLLMKPIAIRYFKASWRYAFIKIVMLFYLIPYQCFTIKSLTNTESLPYNFSWAVFVTPNQAAFSDYQLPVQAFLIFWLFLICCIAVNQLYNYFLCKRAFLQISGRVTSEDADIMKQCCQNIGMNTRRNVRLLYNHDIFSPFTIGVLSPCIIIPDIQLDDTQKRMILTHELMHVKNFDILFKFLALLILLLHWYNPLVYYLFRELNDVSENTCDEMVTQNMREEDIRDYGMLIIEMNGKPANHNLLFSDSFSNNAKIIKKRIKFLHHRPMKRVYSLMTSAVTAMILILSLPVSTWLYTYEDTSNIYELPTTDYTASMAYCRHTWATGMIYEHVPRSAGCTLSIYQAVACTKCGYRQETTLNSSHVYFICSHKEGSKKYNLYD